MGSGNVSSSATDFVSGDGRLRLDRYYNSNPLNPNGQGVGWQNSFVARHISDISAGIGAVKPANSLVYVGNQLSNQYNSPSDACTLGLADLAAQNSAYSGLTATYIESDQCQLSNGMTIPVVTNGVMAFEPSDASINFELMAFRPEGGYERFFCTKSACTDTDHSGDALIVTASGYTLTTTNGDTEYYDRTGALINVVSIDGYTQGIIYNADGTIKSVVDNHNREMDFFYTDGCSTR